MEIISHVSLALLQYLTIFSYNASLIECSNYLVWHFGPPLDWAQKIRDIRRGIHIAVWVYRSNRPQSYPKQGLATIDSDLGPLDEAVVYHSEYR